MENVPNAVPGRLHRDYLYQVIELLLEQGLNPNATVNDEENAMFGLEFTDGPDVAAKTMRLLLEHGGDPNLRIDLDTPLTNVDTAMWVAPVCERWFFDNLVQCAMVLQAYDGYWIGGDEKAHIPFTMGKGYHSKMLREFEKFDYFFGDVEDHPGYVHIVEKATGKIAADYELADYP